MIALYQVLRDAALGFSVRGGDTHAGYIAYAMLLAIFPFLIFATALTGLLIGEERSAQAVAVLFEFAPEYLAETLAPVLVDLLSRKYNVFTLFILLALWAAMRAVEAVARAFDATYGQRDGGVWIVRKVKALVTVVGASVVAVVLGLSILFAPVLVDLIEARTAFTFPENFTIARYAVGLIVFYVFLYALHWYLPSRRVRDYPIWPGALVSTLAWTVMATGMSVYLAYSASYTLTYGTLAGIVITILFLYFSGAIVIFGAEINRAVRERRMTWQG